MVWIVLILSRGLGDYSKGSNYNWYHHHLHVQQLLLFSCKIDVCVFFSPSFISTLRSAGMALEVFFLFIKTRPCLLACIERSVSISRSQRILCVSFSRTDSGMCIYHLSVGLKFSVFHNSHPIGSVLVFLFWIASSCSYVRIRDVVLKTCLGRWTIGRSGEKGSGISMLPARHDDDDDYQCLYWHYFAQLLLLSLLL